MDKLRKELQKFREDFKDPQTDKKIQLIKTSQMMFI